MMHPFPNQLISSNRLHIHQTKEERYFSLQSLGRRTAICCLDHLLFKNQFLKSRRLYQKRRLVRQSEIKVSLLFLHILLLFLPRFSSMPMVSSHFQCRSNCNPRRKMPKKRGQATTNKISSTEPRIKAISCIIFIPPYNLQSV